MKMDRQQIEVNDRRLLVLSDGPRTAV